MCVCVCVCIYECVGVGMCVCDCVCVLLIDKAVTGNKFDLGEVSLLLPVYSSCSVDIMQCLHRLLQ